MKNPMDFENSMIAFFQGYYPDLARSEIVDETDLIRCGVIDSFIFVEMVHHLEAILGKRIDLESLGLDALKSLPAMKRVLLGSNGT